MSSEPTPRRLIRQLARDTPTPDGDGPEQAPSSGRRTVSRHTTPVAVEESSTAPDRIDRKPTRRVRETPRSLMRAVMEPSPDPADGTTSGSTRKSVRKAAAATAAATAGKETPRTLMRGVMATLPTPPSGPSVKKPRFESSSRERSESVIVEEAEEEEEEKEGEVEEEEAEDEEREGEEREEEDLSESESSESESSSDEEPAPMSESSEGDAVKIGARLRRLPAKIQPVMRVAEEGLVKTEQMGPRRDALLDAASRGRTGAVKRTLDGQAKKPRKKKTSRITPHMARDTFLSFLPGHIITTEATEELCSLAHEFVGQAMDDVEAFSEHGRRRVSSIADVELLLRRQGLVNESQNLHSLVHRHLSLDLVEMVVPVARAGNAVHPRPKRHTFVVGNHIDNDP